MLKEEVNKAQDRILRWHGHVETMISIAYLGVGSRAVVENN